MRNGSTLEGRMLWRPSGPDFTTGPDWPSSLLVGPGKRVLNGFVHIASTVTLFSYRPHLVFLVFVLFGPFSTPSEEVAKIWVPEEQRKKSGRLDGTSLTSRILTPHKSG